MDRKSSRISKFDRWMTAVTFAEAGEPEPALHMIGQKSRETNQKQSRRKIRSRIDQRPKLMP